MIVCWQFSRVERCIFLEVRAGVFNSTAHCIERHVDLEDYILPVSFLGPSPGRSRGDLRRHVEGLGFPAWLRQHGGLI